MTEDAIPPDQDPEADPPRPQPTVRLRCGMPEPVSEDGFCAKCEQAPEQACL